MSRCRRKRNRREAFPSSPRGYRRCSSERPAPWVRTSGVSRSVSVGYDLENLKRPTAIDVAVPRTVSTTATRFPSHCDGHRQTAAARDALPTARASRGLQDALRGFSKRPCSAMPSSPGSDAMRLYRQTTGTLGRTQRSCESCVRHTVAFQCLAKAQGRSASGATEAFSKDGLHWVEMVCTRCHLLFSDPSASTRHPVGRYSTARGSRRHHALAVGQAKHRHTGKHARIEPARSVSLVFYRSTQPLELVQSPQGMDCRHLGLNSSAVILRHMRNAGCALDVVRQA